jgi:hypothetical protein
MRCRSCNCRLVAANTQPAGVRAARFRAAPAFRRPCRAEAQRSRRRATPDEDEQYITAGFELSSRGPHVRAARLPRLLAILFNCAGAINCR